MSWLEGVAKATRGLEWVLERYLGPAHRVQPPCREVSSGLPAACNIIVNQSWKDRTNVSVMTNICSKHSSMRPVLRHLTILSCSCNPNLFLLFYSGTGPSYFINLFNWRLVGAVGYMWAVHSHNVGTTWLGSKRRFLGLHTPRHITERSSYPLRHCFSLPLWLCKMVSFYAWELISDNSVVTSSYSISS